MLYSFYATSFILSSVLFTCFIISPVSFKCFIIPSSKWNSLHLVPMNVRSAHCICHETLSKDFRVLSLFEIILYPYTEKVSNQSFLCFAFLWKKVKLYLLIAISDNSSFLYFQGLSNLGNTCFFNAVMQVCILTTLDLMATFIFIYLLFTCDMIVGWSNTWLYLDTCLPITEYAHRKLT